MADWWQGLASPYWPDFESPIELEFEFDTLFNISRSGYEQRVANRPYARVAVSFQSWLKDGRLGAVNQMRQTPNSKVYVPYGYKGFLIDGALEAGDTVLPTLGAPPSWVEAGIELILHSRYADEPVTVLSTGTGSVTVDAGLEYDHQMPARLAVAVQAYPDQKKSRDLIYRNFQKVDKQRFMLDPADPILPISDPYVVMLDREVWQIRANWASYPKVEEEPMLEVIESRGEFEVFSPHEVQTYTRQQTHMLKTPEEQQEFIDFFLRHKGRQKSFHARNYDPFIEATNATPSTYQGPGPRQFTADNQDLYEQFHPHGNDRRIFEVVSYPDLASPALNIRIPPGPGARVITEAPTQVLHPQNHANWTTPQLIPNENGPGETHIDGGLVYCNMLVTGQGYFHTDVGSWNEGDGARFDVDCVVQFDKKNVAATTPPDIARWEQVGGLWRRKVGTWQNDSQHYFQNHNQVNDGDAVITATAQLTCLVPAAARFFRYQLNFFPLPFVGQTYSWLAAYLTFTFGAPANPEEYLELFNPVIGGENGAKIEGYSLYRFGQDRLTVTQRNSDVSEVAVTLRSCNDPTET